MKKINVEKLVLKIVKCIETISAVCVGILSALIVNFGADAESLIALGLSLIILCCTFIKLEEEKEERINEDIQKINQGLPQIRNIGKVVVRDTEFPKTTTKKIKRNLGGQQHA